MENSQTETPLPQPKFPILIIILILALILSLAGSSYLFLQNMKLQKQIAEIKISSTPIPTPASTPIITTNTITGWKIYTDPRGFSFEYPPELLVNNPDNNNQFIYLSEKPQNYSSYYMYINISNNGDFKNNFKFTQESLDGLTLYKTTDLPGRDTSLAVFITQDNKRFVLFGVTPYHPGSTGDKYYNWFNQILSTFKFTN